MFHINSIYLQSQLMGTLYTNSIMIFNFIFFMFLFFFYKISISHILSSFCDWSNHCIDIVSIIIAFITCVFTISMYGLVKIQLRDQLNQFNENKKRDIVVREKTKFYINEIKQQILIDSWASLLQKKYDFIYHFDEFIIQLRSRKTCLVKKKKDDKKERTEEEKKAFRNELEKRKNYYNDVTRCIIDVENNIGYLQDMIEVIDKDNQEVCNEIVLIKKKLEDIKKREGVAEDLRGVELWLVDLKKNKKDFVMAIDKSYNNIIDRIHKDIK